MDVFDLYAKIALDTSEYESGLEGASGKTSSFASKLKSGIGTACKVGAAAVGAVTTAVGAVSGAIAKGVSDVAAYGDNIDKMSQKMGMSAESYQEWDAVMQHCGTSIESMQSSMKTLASAAETGNDAFAKLGISQQEIANMNQEELFSATITALQNVDSETERTYLAGKLLGRGATELGPLLNTSAEDTQKMKDRVHELGGVMSDDAVKAAAAFQDSLQDLKTGFSGAKNAMLGEFLPSCIALSVSNNETSSTIKLMVDGVAVSSKTIRFTGNVVFESDLADGNTVIDGACIQTGQISADYIKLGGKMEVYRTTSSNTCGGYIGYMSGMSSSGAATAGIGITDDTESSVMICTNAGARMGYDGNATVVCTSNKVSLTAGTVVVSGTLMNSSGTVITSDKNKKKDIGYKKFSEYLKIFDNLKPAVFRLKGRTRRHLGFIAQDVEEAVKSAGISTDDFAALCIDEDGSYGLRYEEFIPLLTAKIQQQDQTIQALISRVTALEEMVKNG